MRSGNQYVVQWALLAAALSLWLVVGYLGLMIWGEFDARQSRERNAQEDDARRVAAVRMHALAAETAGARATLETIASADAVAIADVIDEVSRDAGVRVTIGSSQGTQSPGNLLRLRPIAFTLEGNGTFPALFRTVSLLSQLPIPSAVDSAQFTRVADGKSPSSSHWHMVVHIRFFTTKDLSS